MRIFERLRGRSRSDSAIERKLFETVTDDLLRKLEGAPQSLPLPAAGCVPAPMAFPRAASATVEVVAVLPHCDLGWLRSRLPGIERLRFPAGHLPSAAAPTALLFSVAGANPAIEDRYLEAALAGFELVEQRRKDLLCLSDLRNGLGLVDIAGLADHDHRHHSHAVMRQALDAVDAFLLELDGSILVVLAEEWRCALGQHALDRFRVVAFVRGHELYVSPGAIFTKAGSNTITPPSVPLLSSLTSTSAACAPPARAITATAAANIAIFFMIPDAFLFPGIRARNLPGSPVSDIAVRSCRYCASAISGLEFWAKRSPESPLRLASARVPSAADWNEGIDGLSRPFTGRKPADVRWPSPAEQDELLRGARSIRYPKGTAVFDQGVEADRFYILLHGHLRVEKATPQGQQSVVRYVSAGELFGVAQAMNLTHYPATAVAAVDSIALAWPSSSWNRLIAKYPTLASSALQTVGSRLQDTQARVLEMSNEQVEQRVAHALLRLAKQAGRKVDAGVEIDFPISRQDVAEMTGTTLHTVSRILSAWEQQGLVEGGRQRIVLRDAHRLHRLAEGDAAGAQARILSHRFRNIFAPEQTTEHFGFIDKAFLLAPAQRE